MNNKSILKNKFSRIFNAASGVRQKILENLDSRRTLKFIFHVTELEQLKPFCGDYQAYSPQKMRRIKQRERENIRIDSIIN